MKKKNKSKNWEVVKLLLHCCVCCLTVLTVMALCVTFIFISVGLSGIQSLVTVTHVSVETGGSVSIPCQYESEYKSKVKYLCRGSQWPTCSVKIRTDQANSSKYLIFDDKSQRIVTFTIENLEWGDSNDYWCSIEQKGSDDGKRFQLSVTRKAESRLSVDSQWKTAYIGGQITISCNYSGSGEKKWCRVGLSPSCIETSGKIDGSNVTLEAKATAFYSVTMSGLRTENSGWYWCAFKDLQIPVFLSITERPTTTALATTVVTTTTTTTTESTTHKSGSNSVFNPLMRTIIALSVLVFIAMVALGVWFMLKRNTKTEAESLSSQCGEDTIYYNVTKGPVPHQNPCADNEILYSQVCVITKQSPNQQVQVEEEDVVYSTLAHH